MSFTDSEYHAFYHPNMIDIHKLKDGDTLWFLDKETNYYNDNTEYVIHEVKCQNKRVDRRSGFIWSCDFEFYDKKEMCYRCYHKTEHDLENQPKYEGRFFVTFEEAEKHRIEAEALYIKDFLKECYDAMQLALKARDKVETILKRKNIFDEDLFSFCEKYFKETPYNSGSVLYNLSDTIKRKLKKASMQKE